MTHFEQQEPAHHYEPIGVSEESTVAAEFVADPSTQAGYQTEADLVANVRAQLETLNRTTFSDAEWQ